MQSDTDFGSMKRETVRHVNKVTGDSGQNCFENGTCTLNGVTEGKVREMDNYNVRKSCKINVSV
jgi:hypothetical protein